MISWESGYFPMNYFFLDWRFRLLDLCYIPYLDILQLGLLLNCIHSCESRTDGFLSNKIKASKKGFLEKLESYKRFLCLHYCAYLVFSQFLCNFDIFYLPIIHCKRVFCFVELKKVNIE